MQAVTWHVACSHQACLVRLVQSLRITLLNLSYHRHSNVVLQVYIACNTLHAKNGLPSARRDR